MSLTVLLIVYCAAILLASLVGGMLPMLIRLTHRRMEIALSFVSGVMLGVAVLHLLPHAWLERAAYDGRTDFGTIEHVALWLLAGFVGLFLLERFFCFHHHDTPKSAPGAAAGEACGHEHSHAAPASGAGTATPGPGGSAKHSHRLSWSGAAIGLGLHTLINGVALGASVSTEWGHRETFWLAGLGTFLVIVLHKPFDALTISTLMATSGRSLRARHLVNALFALVIPLGVALFFLGVDFESREAHLVVSNALAFSAGAFLCIALSDLLPELQFHQHDRLPLTLALVLGLALAYGVSVLERQSHDHAHHGPGVRQLLEDHDHDHHDHHHDHDHDH